MENIISLFGRFHPLLVHLPIGILFIAFLFEVLSKTDRYRKLDGAVQTTLLWGMLTAAASVVSGYMLSLEGGYPDRLLTLHRNFGIATALFAVFLYFIRESSLVRIGNKKKRKQLRIILFLPLMILLIATGHWGGSMTHGEDFLTEASAGDAEFIDPSVKLRAIANLNDAALYGEVIQPIFESNCYSCHSSKKQKGQLRLDGVDFIRQGGKHGDVIEPGNADSSSLFSRLMLPLEDEHHMPPNEKPQLSAAAIDLIQLWINEGASFDQPVKNFKSSEKIIQAVELLTERSEADDWIPAGTVAPADEQVISQLKAAGALILPVGAGSNYLSVSFMNMKSVTEKELQQLTKLKDQLISLKLSNTPITDKNLTGLSKLDQLRFLYLDNTNITDSTATELAGLSQLQYLNLVRSNVTDKTLSTLSTLKTLKKIYLYETAVTGDGIRNLIEHSPQVEIDTGNYSLPALPGDTIIYKRKV